MRQHNPLNQITKFASTAVSYDDNGNLTDDGTLLLEYDAFNRLKRVKNKSNSQTVGEYTYDAMGRRIRKVVTNGGITGTVPNGTTDYLYDQQQCVEERDGGNSHTKQFVWGTYIDELIQQKTYTTTGGGSLAAGTYYPLQDLHYRVMALTNSSGTIVEAYDYDPYGKRQVYSDDGADTTWFTADDVTTDDASCEYGHQGLMHDDESGLVYNRARMLHPTLGRFAQRDPLEYVDGMSLYTYVRSFPMRGRDPSGTYDPGGLGDVGGPAPIEACCGGEKRRIMRQIASDEDAFRCCGTPQTGSWYNTRDECCENGNVVSKVSYWVCSREMRGFLSFFGDHKFICCDGPNKNCWGHFDNNLKAGDPIPRDGPDARPPRGNGDCVERKVCPKTKEVKCNNPVSPFDAGTCTWNCGDFADYEPSDEGCVWSCEKR